MKTVLFVPGFMENFETRDYRKTIKSIQDKGYKTIFVPIQWRRTTINSWLGELEKEYKKHDPKNTILAGFSFGAVTALMTAANSNPIELWLFSLPPGPFIEDRSKNWLRAIGKLRAEAFKQLTVNNFDYFAKKINCKTLILVGEKEAGLFPALEAITKIAQNKIPDSELIRVPGCDHDVTDERYLSAITKLV